MKRRISINPYFLALAIHVLAGAAHAEGSGVRLNLNRFSLYVEHNDMVPDKIMGMEYLRNPDGLLFDLVVILQNNKKEMRGSEKAIYAHVDGYNKYLSIYQNEPDEKQIHVDDNLKRLKRYEFLQQLCSAMGITGCQCRAEKDETYLYVSDKPLDRSRADVIEFGQFPGTNKLTFALTDRWDAAESDGPVPTFEKIAVNRNSIYNYFDTLE